MPFYVYIIQSLNDSTFYKGYTEYPALRLREHNEGFSTYTSGKGPWIMVYLEAFEIKREALIRERKLKKYSRDKIEVLIQSPKNIVSESSMRIITLKLMHVNKLISWLLGHVYFEMSEINMSF